MIGGLRHRITIQSESKVEDDAGGYALTWSDLVTVWADIMPLSGREVLASQHLQGQVTHRIRIRARTDITTKNRISYGSRVFNIRSVISQAERGRYTEMMCNEGVAT